MFKKKFLIVFEQVPETTDLFFVEATPEEEAKINLCHKHYMNNGEDEDCLLTNLSIEITGTFTVISTGILG